MRSLGMALLCCGMLSFAQASMLRAEDKITYRDRGTGKDVDATGVIQSEAPDRVILKGAATKDIPALDIQEIAYEVPGAVRLDYSRLVPTEKKLDSLKDEERAKALGELIKNYQELIVKLPVEKAKFAHRHLEYKSAVLKARLAEEDPTQMAAAIDALTAFKKEHADGWQITAAAKLLSRLQLAKGDTAGAQKTYQELAAISNLPKETRQECDLLAAQALIEGKKFPEAKAKLDALQKAVTPGDVTASKVEVALATCMAASGDLAKAVPQLEGLIGKTTDKGLKAAAYNALGDGYRLNGKAKEALWAYLWVDVLYNQDKQEHMKAITHLAKLFEELGDVARATQYREKLKRDGK